jgi:uncharacterized repeat protein (TIGR01451 family)/fimbrial isopeptide formation D2 family protein
MKRKLIAFSMTMALLLSVFSAANVGAHSVTIETPALTASRADWFGLQGDGAGIGVVQRNASQQGEYVFNDASKDQRIITTTQPVTRETDLDWFSVTADPTYVYFLAKIDQLSGITNNPSLELLITVDTNQQSGSGTTDLPLVETAGTYSTSKVANDAAWEYAVRTRFTPGASGQRAVNGTTFIYTSPANVTGNGTTCTSPGTCNAQLASASVNQGNFAEVKVRWDQIGGKPTDGKYLRLTVSTLYNTHAVPGDGYNSPVIDVLGTGPTLADLQDGTIDTSIDVHFDTNGEPYAPLMVTEFQPNPIGSDSPGPTNQSTDTEWIEIYNPNSFAITLSDYKISNTPKRGSTSQGAFKFKANLPNSRSIIAAGAVVVVAREKSRFLAGRPTYPTPNLVYDLSADMTQYTAWASGQLQLDNSPPTTGPNAGFFEEQVLLLDAKDDIVDMATYGNENSTTIPAAYPGHTPFVVTSVPEGVSYERCPALRDTNNSSVDFAAHNTPGEETPGAACNGVPGLDLTVTKTGPSNPVKDDVTQARYVPYTITYSNIGINPEAGIVTVVDTLPAGLSFTNTPDNASPLPTSVNGQTLTWSFPAGLAAGASGTIALTTTVDVSVLENIALVNNVSISGATEPPAAQNNNTASWTTTTLGPADTSVSSNLSGPMPPGAQFQFTITYRNIGQDDATDVSITDVLPTGVTILSEDSPDATWDNATTGTVTWDVGTLPPNGSGTIVVTGQLASSAVVGTVLQNSLNITTPVGDPITANNTEIKPVTVGLRKLYLTAILK